MANHPATQTLSPVQGIDRKRLKQIRQRFMQVNLARLTRTRQSLSRQQQAYLDLLPLFFHVNHPILPGFVSRSCPKGVMHYDPAKVEVQKAQRLANSFTHRRQPGTLCQIEALFLMGSCGTVAQSHVSDLDIWLCHSSGLSYEARTELQNKCHKLEAYAAKISLEVHFFLMDADQFRQGQRAELSTEDCGSSQHFLLLDEFYRTGLLIAGCPPIWWLIPPKHEPHYDAYANRLRDQRYIRQNQTIDFGGLPTIPAGEFVGAGIWQLYKGIESPYKSVLKLMIIEVYASEFPQVDNLSAVFKRAIYNEQLDIDELDPYVTIYRKLERYLLSRNESERLELVRRCFYIKVGKRLSRPPQRKASWQRLLMQKLVSQWGWSEQHLRHLDNHKYWHISQVTEERHALVRELTSSYRFLVAFADKHAVDAHISAEEMAILGRKLYAAFERRAGKVEAINPGISNYLSKEVLSFQHQEADNTWCIYPQKQLGDLPLGKPIKRSQHIMELLAWCHLNGVMNSSSYLQASIADNSLSDNELLQIKLALEQVLSRDSIQALHDNQPFKQAARLQKLVLFVNVGLEPMTMMREKGLQRLSSQTDSLGYSGLRENLIASIDAISLNSWHELSTQQYAGESAIVDCLADYLRAVPPEPRAALPELEIFCFSGSRGHSIVNRLKQLFEDFQRCFYRPGDGRYSRYVLQVRNSFYIVQALTKKQVRLSHAKNLAALHRRLGEPQSRFSPIVLDPYALQEDVLAELLELNQADLVQVCFQQLDRQQAKVFILDENGALSVFNTPFYNPQTLCQSLQQFVQAIQFRQRNEQESDELDNPLLNPAAQHTGLRFYEIKKPALNKKYQLLPFSLNHYVKPSSLDVEAIAKRSKNNKIVFDIYCQQQEFSHLEWGDEIYHKLAAFLLTKRCSDELYPCYITDIDLSQAQLNHAYSNSSSQYLRYKQLLEKRLNDALLELWQQR